MVAGNAFQILMNLKKTLLAILFVRQKGFNREGPDERVEIVVWILVFPSSTYADYKLGALNLTAPRNRLFKCQIHPQSLTLKISNGNNAL